MIPTETPAQPDTARPLHGWYFGGKFWASLSLVFSTGLLLWSFSLPFRSSQQPLLESTPVGITVATVSETQADDHPAADYRREAVEVDRFFLESVRRQRQQREQTPLPGIEQTRQRWQQHSESVHRQLRELADAPEGSLQWQYRQDLLRSLSDGPQ